MSKGTSSSYSKIIGAKGIGKEQEDYEANGDTVAAPPVVITRGSKIRPMEIRLQRPQVGGGRPSAPSSGGGSAASSKGGGK